ncbi:MAG: hypothetical protein EXS03_07645 [Phycisphaerales bacterium]|nr:hypothetical protein [Phycisphaerales bacterium]
MGHLTIPCGPKCSAAIVMAVCAVALASPAIAGSTGGPVKAWGLNGSGQTSVPTSVGPCIAIAAGYEHSVAIDASGYVRA